MDQAKDHPIRLLELRDPDDRSLVKTLHLGLVDDLEGAPERFFCASERRQAYAAARRVETTGEVGGLEVVRGRGART